MEIIILNLILTHSSNCLAYNTPVVQRLQLFNPLSLINRLLELEFAEVFSFQALLRNFYLLPLTSVLLWLGICKVKRSYRKAVDFLLPLFVTFAGNRKYVLACSTYDRYRETWTEICVCFFIVGNVDTKMNSRFAYSFFFLKEQSVIEFIRNIRIRFERKRKNSGETRFGRFSFQTFVARDTIKLSAVCFRIFYRRFIFLYFFNCILMEIRTIIILPLFFFFFEIRINYLRNKYIM